MIDAYFRIADGYVEVTTDSAEVEAYLKRFYPVIPRPTTGLLWTFRAFQHQPTGVFLHITKYGVQYSTDIPSKLSSFQCDEVTHLKITLRHAIREVFLHYCETKGFTMLHGSAIGNEDHLILFLGHNCAGKTTLALDAVLNHGYRLISNDYLLTYSFQGKIIFTTLPAFVSIKIGTYLYYENRLPCPDGSNEVDIPRFRSMEETQLRGLDVPLYYSFSDLHQEPLPSYVITTGNDSRKLVVVLASFSKDSGKNARLSMVRQPLDCIKEHVRSKWIYSEYNSRLLNLPRRPEAVFMGESLRFVETVLSEHSPLVISYAHLGKIDDLLACLRQHDHRSLLPGNDI